MDLTIPPIKPIEPWNAVLTTTPFTTRDGDTYLKILRRLYNYINDDILPSLDSSNAAIEAEFELVMANINSVLNGFRTDVNDALAEILASSVTLQDPVLNGIIADTGSASRITLNAVIADFISDLEAEINADIAGVSATISTLNGEVSNRRATVSDKTKCVGIGDSISDNTYETALAALTGMNVTSLGTSGEISSTTAMRFGAISLVVSAPFTIPANAAVSFSAVASVKPFNAQAGRSFPATVAGVAGTMTIVSGSGAGAIDGVVNAKFTRTNVGDPVNVIAGQRVTPTTGANHRASRAVIWLGVNDQQWLDPNHVALTVASVTAIVNNLSPDVRDFIILTPLTGTDLSARKRTLAISTALIAKFPGRVYDIRSHMINYGLGLLGLVPTAQDSTDIANDTVPTTLRTDTIHPTAAAYAGVIAPYIRDVFERRVSPATEIVSEWESLTVNAAATGTVDVMKKNGIVYVRIDISAGTFNAATSLVTLPQRYVPASDQYFPIIATSDNATMRNGVIRVWGGASLTATNVAPAMRALISYPAKIEN